MNSPLDAARFNAECSESSIAQRPLSLCVRLELGYSNLTVLRSRTRRLGVSVSRVSSTPVRSCA